MISEGDLFIPQSSTLVDRLSTSADRKYQQMLHNRPMAMGKRIKQCLDDLGWKPSDLLDRVPELSPQSLSALTTRDSKTSTFAGKIANALGVRLDWLLFGSGDQWVLSGPIGIASLDGGSSSSQPGQDDVLKLLRRIEDKVTPRSRATLLRLEKLAIEGKLTDDDWTIIEQITARFERANSP